MKKKTRILVNLGLAIFFIVAYIVNPSNLNPIYADGAFSILFFISAFLVVNIIQGFSGLNISQNGQIRSNGKVVDINFKKKSSKGIIVAVIVLWVIYFIVNTASMPLFNSKAYRDQLGELEVSQFSEDIQLLDLTQVPIVDKSLAKTLADKKLGENAGMGSQVYVGEPVIQQVEGELVWVVPLLHSGFFKWLNNMDGSPGYIVVSATNLEDIEYVESLIKYQPNSYLFDDISRYLRVVKGYAFTAITDYSFEIDDNNQPYWIITTYKNEWLYDLPEATGVITLNATTGETNEYSVDEIPEWIDRVQPEEFIVNQIDNQGLYVHGVFNFSNLDKYVSSGEKAIIYNDGNCYLFTGLTSVGADESAIGFVMVDMVTKEPSLYEISGATEFAAMESAEGSVQQYGYNATSPIIINHSGIPTYFITLKDSSGLIKQYAFVSVANVTSVGVGSTINEALRSYNTALGSSSSFVTNTGDLLEYTGKVIRVADENLNSVLNYKFILEGMEDKIFVIDADISDELALTLVGDEVKVSYYETDAGIIEASKFDNLEFNQ